MCLFRVKDKLNRNIKNNNKKKNKGYLTRYPSDVNRKLIYFMLFISCFVNNKLMGGVNSNTHELEINLRIY